MRAAERISLFALKLGLKMIAAMGKIDIQAHNGNIEITASETLVLTGIKGVIINGQMFQVNTQGAGLDMGNGAITSKTTGAHTAHAAQHTVSGPADANFTPPNMPQSTLKTDEKFATAGRAGQAREQLPYQISEPNSNSLLSQGSTAGDGGTEITQDSKIKGLNLKLKDE